MAILNLQQPLFKQGHSSSQSVNLGSQYNYLIQGCLYPAGERNPAH
jgi:hypothetical protein